VGSLKIKIKKLTIEPKKLTAFIIP